LYVLNSPRSSFDLLPSFGMQVIGNLTKRTILFGRYAVVFDSPYSIHD
jgi:hypothetical protein